MPASVCRNHVVQTLPDFLVTSTRDNTSFYNEAAIRIIDGEDGGIANKMSLMDISEHPSQPERTPYELIGGELKVRALVTHFYGLMDEDPDYFGIRKLHPESLAGSREKLFMFLTGWLGGPQLYVEAFGHPRLRARHLPFLRHLGARPVDGVHVRAMQDIDVPEALRLGLVASFANTADWMRNREL